MITSKRSPMGEEWDRQFGFLDRGETEIGGDMRATYLTLLALATSTRDMERLHARLPANCQLLYDDLHALKQFWLSQIGLENPPFKTRPLSTEAVSRILATHCHERSLCSYYADRLLKGRFAQLPASGSDPELDYWNTRGDINSWLFKAPVRDGATGSFRIKLQGIWCRALCALASDRKKVMVYLRIPSGQLTASITYQLLTMPQVRCYSVDHDEVPYALLVNAATLLPLIESAPLQPLPEYEQYISGEQLYDKGFTAGVKFEFYAELQRLLHEINVPAQDVTRQPTWLERLIKTQEEDEETSEVSDSV